MLLLDLRCGDELKRNGQDRCRKCAHKFYDALCGAAEVLRPERCVTFNERIALHIKLENSFFFFIIPRLYGKHSFVKKEREEKGRETEIQQMKIELLRIV